MIGIIEEWLLCQLGINYKLTDLEENNIFRDGQVFCDIFQKYGLIDASFKVNISPTKDVAVCKKNLQSLKPVFGMLNVKFDETVISGIVNNRHSAVMMLLYELYVHLENKQHLYFITRQKYEKIQKTLINTSNLESLNVKLEDTDADRISENSCFEQPLIKNKDIIEWYRSKYKKIKENLETRIKTTRTEVVCMNKTDLKKERKPCSCSVDKRVERVEPLPDFDRFTKSGSRNNLLNYDQFITKFKTKQRQIEAKNTLESHIQNDLLQQTWSKIMEKQKELYNSVFTGIMLKQSQYEKQLLTKLIRTQQQIKVQNENKIYTSKKVIEEEENYINTDFELQEKFEMLQRFQESEKKRVLELHKKLYKEKQDLIKKRHNSLCKEVMDDLIDLAINFSEYKEKYGAPVPKSLWYDWMQMFFKSQSIHVPLQRLEGNGNIDYDDIIAFERDQDDFLNENGVDEYLFTCGRWFLKHICMEYSDLDEKCLSFIVYRLLTLKYPFPPSPLPAEIPPFKLAGILLNVYKVDCIEKLKVLLSQPRIHVFDCDCAIKKCISAFQKETALPIEETIKGKRKKSKGKGKKGITTKEHEMGEGTKSPKRKSSKKNKKTPADMKENEKEPPINICDKETQTSIVKEDELKRSEHTPLGIIGEEVFNVLKLGEKIDDRLMVSVITEYLKSLEDVDGWLLLNYPLTIEQAIVLELALTGKSIPLEYYVTEDIETLQEAIIDEFDEKRKSKILPCPVPREDSSSFKTHFTVFITAKETTIVNDQIKVSSNSENESIGSEDTQKPDILEKLYHDQFIYKEFPYFSLDVPTLKKLARIVLNEDGVTSKGSVELFGEESLKKLTKEKKKGKTIRGSSNNKKPKVDKKSKQKDKQKGPELKVSIQQELIENDNTTEVEDQFTAETETDPNGQPKEINPGDDNWENVSIPFDLEIARLLATMWENIEMCYLNNLKDICFENRVISLRLVPYCTYVQEEIKKVKNKPDLKQNLVNTFQNYYNSIDNDIRILPELKCHLHCKVFELQQNLWQIADNKKKETEKRRQDIIRENWLAGELTMLINNYLSIVQTEFDRSLETFKLVFDYYLTMLGKNLPIPSDVQTAHSGITKLSKEILQLTSNSEPTISSNIKLDQKSQSEATSLCGYEEIDGFITKALINCANTEEDFTTLSSFLTKGIEQATNKLQAVLHAFQSQIKTEEKHLLLSSGQKSVKEKTISKIEKSPRTLIEKAKKKPSMKQNLSPKPEVTTKCDDDVAVHERLLKEWKFVVDMEMYRFIFRMSLITRKAKEDVLEFYSYLESTFCDMYNSTMSKYNVDISNIDKLCNYIKTAIEEESPLTQPLVFTGDLFYVNIGQVPKERNIKFTELTEAVHECCFTIAQLTKLRSIFMVAAPCGIINKQPLIYILQDLMLFNDDNNQPLLPKSWNLLNESKLRCAIETMFGLEYVIDWRNFIIYSLEIPYPTVDDILALRRQFLLYDLEEIEIVPKENYANITLWFEKELPASPQEGLRIAMIKELLFDIFKVDDNNVNYTALLLYFCKDFDPKLGLRKALSLSVGKNVIMSKEELDEILQEEADIKKAVLNLLEEIVNSIVFNREAVLIYEIFESSSVVSGSCDSKSVSNYSVSLASEETSSVHSDRRTEKLSSLENKSQITQTESILTKHSFLDIQQEKSWVSKIPVSAVLGVLNAYFHHQDKTDPLRNSYMNCFGENTDKLIEAHKLMDLTCMRKLFATTKKFTISVPSEIIIHCLGD